MKEQIQFSAQNIQHEFQSQKKTVNLVENPFSSASADFMNKHTHSNKKAVFFEQYVKLSNKIQDG